MVIEQQEHYASHQNYVKHHLELPQKDIRLPSFNVCANTVGVNTAGAAAISAYSTQR